MTLARPTVITGTSDEYERFAELLRSLTDLLANILGGDWLGLALQALAAISA